VVDTYHGRSAAGVKLFEIGKSERAMLGRRRPTRMAAAIIR